MGIDWPLVAEAEPHLVNQWFGSLSDMVVAAAAEAAPVQAEAVAAEAAPAHGGGCGGSLRPCLWRRLFRWWLQRLQRLQQGRRRLRRRLVGRLRRCGGGDIGAGLQATVGPGAIEHGAR